MARGKKQGGEVRKSIMHATKGGGGKARPGHFIAKI